MKKSVIFLVLFFLSCTIQKQNFDRKNEKATWIFTFKSNVLKSCLIESYGNEFEKVLRDDQSIIANSEVLTKGFFVFTDSLGMIVGKKNNLLPDDSDFKGKKNTLNNCLFYYNSQELDSIANMQYKIYKKLN